MQRDITERFVFGYRTLFAADENYVLMFPQLEPAEFVTGIPCDLLPPNSGYSGDVVFGTNALPLGEHHSFCRSNLIGNVQGLVQNQICSTRTGIGLE